MIIRDVGEYLRQKSEKKSTPMITRRVENSVVGLPETINYEAVQNAMMPNPPKPEKNIEPLRQMTLKTKKVYNIGETRDEIIQNIIAEKPSVSNVRQALSKYAELVMEEDLF